MYWISSDTLVDRFRTGRFESQEVGPYFLASMVFGALGMIMPSYTMNAWDFVAGLAGFAITIGGLLHLKQCNGGTFGKGYLERYFALGWITGIRLALAAIPIAVVFLGGAAVIGGDDALEPASAVLIVLLLFAWYRYTGLLFVESQAGFAGPEAGEPGAP